MVIIFFSALINFTCNTAFRGVNTPISFTLSPCEKTTTAHNAEFGSAFSSSEKYFVLWNVSGTELSRSSPARHEMKSSLVDHAAAAPCKLLTRGWLWRLLFYTGHIFLLHFLLTSSVISLGFFSCLPSKSYYLAQSNHDWSIANMHNFACINVQWPLVFFQLIIVCLHGGACWRATPVSSPNCACHQSYTYRHINKRMKYHQI